MCCKNYLSSLWENSSSKPPLQIRVQEDVRFIKQNYRAFTLPPVVEEDLQPDLHAVSRPYYLAKVFGFGFGVEEVDIVLDCASGVYYLQLLHLRGVNQGKRLKLAPLIGVKSKERVSQVSTRAAAR